jgi:hypothetical protein
MPQSDGGSPAHGSDHLGPARALLGRAIEAFENAQRRLTEVQVPLRALESASSGRARGSRGAHALTQS